MNIDIPAPAVDEVIVVMAYNRHFNYGDLVVDSDFGLHHGTRITASDGGVPVGKLIKFFQNDVAPVPKPTIEDLARRIELLESAKGPLVVNFGDAEPPQNKVFRDGDGDYRKFINGAWKYAAPKSDPYWRGGVDYPDFSDVTFPWTEVSDPS